VVSDELTQDPAEVPLVLRQHLAWLVKRVVAVAHELTEPNRHAYTGPHNRLEQDHRGTKQRYYPMLDPVAHEVR
jgi:hypothetical protein